MISEKDQVRYRLASRLAPRGALVEIGLQAKDRQEWENFAASKSWHVGLPLSSKDGGQADGDRGIYRANKATQRPAPIRRVLMPALKPAP